MLRAFPYLLIAVAIIICVGYTFQQTVMQGQVELILEEEAEEEGTEEEIPEEEVLDEEVVDEETSEEE